ncbi:putative serine threonine-protein kinase ppk6 protein [Botrytis fragariae]|uniref:non-specific serine/threonine protein kinase n=1 Tax=Botrytis fragariae TaxID=1964551 RepID=A0A8H6AUN5_9HELO|nr:putative serine threonine-protein kinase ppk6 protein [Botrytis fragariae]KAF5873921.1 putative serine threonine-protein kinase ppk6 protein [Botrytis fragariae]
MLKTDTSNNHAFENKTAREPDRDRNLSIPKNRSTGNLLAHASAGPDRARIRFSFDDGLAAAEFDTMSRSPVVTEHEHGLGASGLRRIRQQVPRVPVLPASEGSSRAASMSARSSSMTLPFSGRAASVAMPSGPSSPILPFTEDLTRFPSESLHSFSFAHQSDEFIHNRQNVLKRSVEFMSQKLGWGTTSAGIASAQARVNGDAEMQGMLELLAKAKLVGANNIGAGEEQTMGGPLTGPATSLDSRNIFDASFAVRSESPEPMESSPPSPTSAKKVTISLHTLREDDLQSIEPQKGLATALPADSEPSSRTPTNESRTTAQTSPPVTRRQSLKRTYTDLEPLSLQNKLMDAMSQPYIATDSLHESMFSPSMPQTASASTFGHSLGSANHSHSSRWAPAAQAIFTTESTSPYTILAANDLACLVFGVTKAEVRKMGILEVVQKERRPWLEEKLSAHSLGTEVGKQTTLLSQNQSQQSSSTSTTSMLLGRPGGITASLLSKPNSRQVQKPTRRAQTDDGAGSSLVSRTRAAKGGSNHQSNKSRGVLLCGDVVPIEKRNGATGSASLWVKEKRGGLIWVLEEIHEDVAIVSLDDDAAITKISGSIDAIWGTDIDWTGMDIGKLLPRLPRQGIDGRSGEIDYAEVSKRRYFTARTSGRVHIPAVVDRVPSSTDLRVSSFPHIAGIMVLSAQTLKITSSNSVFSAALFGQDKPDGRLITDLIPDFDRMLKILVEEDGVDMVDGIVIPEHSFRRAQAFLALRDGKADASTYFLRPDGLSAKHRDGSELKIDAQLRVVKSDPKTPAYDENVIEEISDEEDGPTPHEPVIKSELVYALWITYSRNIHAAKLANGMETPMLTGLETPLHQPSPGQTGPPAPIKMDSSDSDEPKNETSHASMLTAQLKAAAKKTAAKFTGRDRSFSKAHEKEKPAAPAEVKPVVKKSIDDFTILEEMGQGAYGQVKLARFKKNGNNKVILKYVTKKRILVDTWTRDRRLGTVPLKFMFLIICHPNIVEMSDFFEDSVNYYIEMVPHGYPGMDLFDYIELKVNMEEKECRSIFAQVARAIHHLHTKALVVHRDIKDENIVINGEGSIKLIDFGSAAYIKSGPFDVFVGTIDYAAPEVLSGKPYHGKPQDVWALGILLYTIVYKENPFYSIDEIMDRDLRVPYVMSEESIDLIRGMLNRDVDSRLTIEQVMDHPWCVEAEDDE